MHVPAGHGDKPEGIVNPNQIELFDSCWAQLQIRDRAAAVGAGNSGKRRRPAVIEVAAGRFTWEDNSRGSRVSPATSRAESGREALRQSVERFSSLFILVRWPLALATWRMAVHRHQRQFRALCWLPARRSGQPHIAEAGSLGGPEDQTRIEKIFWTKSR